MGGGDLICLEVRRAVGYPTSLDSHASITRCNMPCASPRGPPGALVGATVVPYGCANASSTSLRRYLCALATRIAGAGPARPTPHPSRWRLLEGKIPDREELSAKIQVGWEGRGGRTIGEVCRSTRSLLGCSPAGYRRPCWPCRSDHRFLLGPLPALVVRHSKQQTRVTSGCHRF